MYDICCVGHITLDKIVNKHTTTHLPGGTAWYFSKALQKLDADYLLITAVADTEKHFIKDLEQTGTNLKCYESTASICFENIYGDNQDERSQNVLQKADTFQLSQLEGIDAKIFHLGPLVADDIPMELIPALAERGQVSLDVQGYLRTVEGTKVFPTQWEEASKYLKHVTYLKANEMEVFALTGYEDPYEAAASLRSMGVQEVIITKGSQGSLIFKDRIYYDIPAISPDMVVDATGCGDTYMAGYLYQRVKGTSVKKAGNFAAAMATLKIQQSGAFVGNETMINQLLTHTKTTA